MLRLILRGAPATLALLASTTALAQIDTSGNDGKNSGAQPGTVLDSGSQQQAPQAPEALLGNWGGIKSGLKDAGITVVLGYKGEFTANVSGGARKDATEVGQFALTGTFDMEKIAGVKGGTFQTTITYRHGPNLTSRAGLGVLQQVQEVYGRGQTWRLTEMWYQQIAADGHLVMKVGRVPAGDFNTFDCDFTNLTFCGAMAGNLIGYYWFNYPIAQWTGWVKVRSDNAYVKFGVNEDNRNNLDNAFFVSRGGAKGIMYHAEAGYTPTFGGGKLPGSYRVGGWYTTSRDPDVLLGVDRRPVAVTGLAPLQREGQYGFYVQGQQQLTGEASRDSVSDVTTRKRGLNLFFNVARTDPRTATQLDQETVGLYVNAPFAARPKDFLGVAVGRTHYNGRAARALLIQTPGSDKPTNEYASEIFYAAALLPGMVVRPQVQYVMDPGGYSHATDVVILGTRIDVNF